MSRVVIHPTQSRASMQQWLRYELAEDDDGEEVDVDVVKAEELQRRGDDYRDKLAKFVPAESVAFFLGIYYLAESNPWRLLILAVGVVGSVAYLFLASGSSRTFPHFYVLAAGAFLAWAIGTSDVGVRLLSLTEQGARIVLLVAVFLIPAADGVIAELILRRREQTRRESNERPASGP